MSVQGFLPRANLAHLIEALRRRGYDWFGPQVRDGAIVYTELDSLDALPQGVADQQAPGRYRLADSGRPRLFDWAVGPQALKPLTFAPQEVLWHCERDADGRMQFVAAGAQSGKHAVLGVRACDLAALALQDAHFLDGEHVDPYYAARRRQLFLVAVHCTAPADTCFCASTGDGPRADSGFDLALSELDSGYLVESGSEQGAEVCIELELTPATDAHKEAAAREIEAAAHAQTRRLPGRQLRDRLFAELEHPRWQVVAGRCLACGNCTQVCPTCFCHAENEVPTLNGDSSRHERAWDSCFTQGHSYFAHSVVRDDTRLRYRQWLTHKLGGWHDQFGRSGCVGCGRCITWCPVGIDLTEEAGVICE